MSDDLQEQFESAESGASKVYPAQCSSLRKNGYVVMKGRPCKIVEMSTSKTGKHGHAKVHMVAIDLYNGKKYEDICPSTHNMDVPFVKRLDYTLVDINDEFCSLMDDSGDIREDIKVPDNEVGEEVKQKFADEQNFLVTVLVSMGIECIIATKNVVK